MCMAKSAPQAAPAAVAATPASAPMVAPIDKAAAPTLAVATSALAAMKKKRAGTKSLRVDLTAPQGGSGLNIN